MAVVKVSVSFVAVCPVNVNRCFRLRRMSTNFENYKDYRCRLMDMWIVGSAVNVVGSHRQRIQPGNFFSIRLNSVWAVCRHSDRLCYMRTHRCRMNLAVCSYCPSTFHHD